MIALLAFLMTFAGNASAHWLDRSHSIFLPGEMSQRLESQQRFPAFWWNFLIHEARGEGHGDPDGEADEVRVMCSVLQSGPVRQFVRKSGCGGDLGQLQAIAASWARDYPRRHPMPADKDLRAAFGRTLSQATLPLDHSLIGILRLDPFASYRELQERAESRLGRGFTRVGGELYDPATRRWVVPVQLAFPPTDSEKTRAFEQALGAKGTDGSWDFLGPHAATLENENRVMQDLASVSRVGGLLTLALGAAALFFGRARLLLLAFPVSAAVGVGILGTIGVCGSIHGLTLSFGTGIIGLALDYGLLCAFNRRSSRIWKANLFGVLTTLVGLLMLMTSKVPLLRQLMIFSSIGLGAAFLLIYLLGWCFPRWLEAAPARWGLGDGMPSGRDARWRLGVVLALVASALVGLFTLRPSLDMAQLNFQGQRAAELSRWLYPRLEAQPPLLRISTGTVEPLENAWLERRWAEHEGIPLENAAMYLPPEEEQVWNLASWRRRICDGKGESRLKALVDPVSARFFEPWLETLRCDALRPLSATEGPAYLEDLRAGNQWLTLWLPDSDVQGELIRKRFPDALSLRDVVAMFPEILSRELRWMAPLSVALATLLLLAYFRSARGTLIALMPFFSGMGLVTLATLALGFPFTFVSVIGLVMVFGFSFDYGIFASELAEGNENAGIRSAISFAALATASGFLPLLFCKHPVLTQLGETLFFGAVGTYLGAIWGVPLMRASVGKKGRR